RGELRAEIQRVPLAVQIEAEFMFAGRSRGYISFDDEHNVEFFQQPRRGHAVEVLKGPVVGQNLHLAVRKNDGEKKGAAARALARLINAHGRRAAMMAVGNVEKRDARECLSYAPDGGRVGDRPARMAHL